MKGAVRFSVRNKLFFFVVLAFSLLITLTIWQIRQQAKRASATVIESSLNQSSTILSTVFDRQFFSIREVANSISKDGRVLPLVFESDSPTLQDLSTEFREAFAFDSLFFVDGNGVILARSDRPEAIGRSLLGKSSIFDTALGGKTTQGAIVSGGKILQIVVEPIFDNVAADVVRGLVAVAYELSEEMTANIQKLTSSDVGIFVFSRAKDRSIEGVTGVYLTNTKLRDDLQAYFATSSMDWAELDQQRIEDLTLQLDNEDYYSVIKPISSYDDRPLGFIMTFRSKSELMKPFVSIEKAVLLIGLFCLLVAVIIALLLAYRISAPLLRLVDITDDIQEGKFPEEKISTKKPSDEIELLFNSVVKMGNSIREKNELEGYLAGLATSLEGPEIIDHQGNSGNYVAVNQATYSAGDLDKTVISKLPNKKDLALEGNSRHRRAIDRIEIGDIIDTRYCLLKCIGEGVFGKVFLARDQHLDEDIAIKIMDKNRLRRSQVGIDMHEEIKLARRITHRNITRTYDFGSFDNFLYITMEYVEGYTLNGLIETKGAIGVYPAIILAKQLCAAIHAAHEQGIIHRDLKPQNISISQQGVLKIMDFGLAVSLDTITEKQRDKIQKIAAGTPRFMAPEQFVGGKLDIRTDIYALGGLTFYVFAGKPPYDAVEFEGMATLHRSALVPSLLQVNSEIPPEIDAIVQRAMQKKPDMRFQSAKEMFDGLNKVQNFLNARDLVLASPSRSAR